MNFVAFPVGATNIFPLANSSAGGQLMSEFNIRSRESVATSSKVKYFIGPSYTHSAADFAVYSQKDGYGTIVSNTVVQIQPGRALINGHFVELLAPINIDLNDANYLANQEGIAALKGDLSIGLKMAYSTYQTLAGSALAENDDDYYDGVQVVILPTAEVKLPTDVPGETQFSKVNMHLLLGTFTFRNGAISRVTQNADKIRSIDAERISNIDGLLASKYITKSNLDPNRLYVFAGKSTDGQTVDGRDTWCDSTDSLMVWDNHPTIDIARPSSQAYFRYDSVTEDTSLVIPHKQVDGMKNAGGQTVYYQDQVLKLPTADYERNTGGVITSAYTRRIKELDSKINSFYRLPNGQLRQYLPVLSSREDLPLIPELSSSGTPNYQLVGDYVLVGEDQTVIDQVNGRYPSTMYVIGPPQVISILQCRRSGNYLTTSTTINISHGTDTAAYKAAYQAMLRKIPAAGSDFDFTGGVELASAEISEAPTPGIQTTLWDAAAYAGVPNKDYFVARLKSVSESGLHETWTCYYFTPETVSSALSYLDPIWVTGGVPLASETSVGGFVNVPDTAYGNGYVRLNDDGYLQLMDYELLLTGVMAYQLGQDYTEGAGLSLEELQAVLDEHINDRVAFPGSEHIQAAINSGDDPYIIHLYLELPADEGTLQIHDLGSRYGTSVCVHISGAATSNTHIIVRNCDKLRIDNNIEGAPTIDLDSVNLYYDAEVLDRVNNISKLSLWYERYDDTQPDLQVDGMTVTLLGRIESTETIDPWDSTFANDNHYSYALRSLTFGEDGSIINVGMLVGDSTTANIDTGRSAFAAEFLLPQSVGLGYPSSRMTHKIKITGSFVSHYYLPSDHGYMMKHTEFSAVTQRYSRLTNSVDVKGTISFYTDAQILSHINGVDPETTIDGWDLNTPHFFTGGAVD